MARRKKGKPSLLAIIVIIVIALFGVKETGIIDIDNSQLTNSMLDGEVYVHFIDVGQGSSTLIQQGESGILVDSGLSEYGDTVSDFIKSCGVKKLEYVIATHPHDDHIGSLPQVMEDFTVGEIIMPELSEMNTPTTKVYERLLDYIIENDITVNAAEFGDIYEMEDVSFQILGPVEQKKDLNYMSVICKVYAGDSSFMLLGDAEKDELSSVCEYNESYNLSFDSDVILMGHHGSSTSVCEEFLDMVDADTAVISCGRNNSYNHPHREALQYCKDNGMEIVRTDIDGTISYKCTADGMERVA